MLVTASETWRMLHKYIQETHMDEIGDESEGHL